MLKGWERNGTTWFLTRDGAVLGGAAVVRKGAGEDWYRAINANGRPLGAGEPLQDLDAVKDAVEAALGVKGAWRDLRAAGVQTVYRVLCSGSCGTYLHGGQEWWDHKDALRAARDAGWLTREDLNSNRASRLACCPDCRRRTSST